MSERRNMGHMVHLPAVAAGDVSVLKKKEETYQGSWKAAGGRSAWFMFRRNMDRLMEMCKHVPFTVEQDQITIPGGTLTLGGSDLERLKKSLRSEDIFKLIEAAPSGADGTVLACLRDLRRYAMLVEAEMVFQGIVTVETFDPPSVLDSLLATTSLTSTSISDGYIDGSKLKVAPNRPLEPFMTGVEHTTHINGGTIGEAPIAISEEKLREMGWRPLGDDLSAARTDYSEFEKREMDLHTRLGNESIRELLAFLRPDASAEGIDAMQRVALRHLEEYAGDMYLALSIATSLDRGVVKVRLFSRMYGKPYINPQHVRSEQITDVNPEPVCDEQGSDTQPDDWERRVFSTIVNLAFPTLADGERQDIMERSLATNPGGCVYNRIGIASGSVSYDIKDRALGRAYTYPNEDVVKPPRHLEQHKKIARALSHAINRNGLDSSLNVADHILAEFLTIDVVREIHGLTDVQLVEAGWTCGPHGVPVPPPGHTNPSALTLLPDFGGQARVKAVVEASKALAEEEQFSDEPSCPGTPADGGHHALPLVPRPDTRSTMELCAELLRHTQESDSEVHAAVLLRDQNGAVGTLRLYCIEGGTWWCQLRGRDRPTVFRFEHKMIDAYVSAWVAGRRPGRSSGEKWV